MKYLLVFRKEAELDLEEIQEYYHKIRPALADDFFKEFFGTLKFVGDGPQLFQVRYREIRIAPLLQISLWYPL